MLKRAENPSGRVELVGDAGEGSDWAWVRLTVEQGRIRDASGGGPGAPELCRDVRGLGLLEAAAVAGDRLAADALAVALAPAIEAPPSHSRVVVALSGGLDSSVALLRARAAGLAPVGVTLRLWLDPAGPDTNRACCSPAAVIAARELCHGLGVPHVTLDARETFRKAIVRPFVESYERGETPNPCIACNGGFRFAELLRFADRVGSSRLATGHYARLRVHRGRLLLARAVAADKDQSYMLARLDPGVLPRLWFPLGDQGKEETRAEARAAGLPVAGRPESQEACFLAGDDYRRFLARQGLAARDGPIVDPEGRQLGRHSGFWGFTPGQRRGLRLATATGPLYTIRTDPEANAVVVGPRSALERTRVELADARLHVPVRRVEAKLRYRSPAVAAEIDRAGSALGLRLDAPASGVAPGQVAVLYEEDAVVGSGLIAAAS